MLRGISKIVLFLFFFFSATAAGSSQAPVLELWQIQGSGRVSPYQGQLVTSNANTVTALGNGFFFVQTPGERSDGNMQTSDGMMVLQAAPAGTQAGSVVNITGYVKEVNGNTVFDAQNLLVTLVSGGSPLPAPVGLDEQFPSGAVFAVPQLEWVENMRVQFTGTASGPSEGNGLVPLTARDSRPFREPGILSPGLAGLPVWDGNPEVFWLDPNGLNQPDNRFINAGTRVTATGILTQSGSRYVCLPVTYQPEQNLAVSPVRSRIAGEITVGSLNALRLLTGESDFVAHAKKLARYIVEIMDTPDILALQEIGSLSALQFLNFYIGQLNPASGYTPYFLSGNDEIHCAYLVRSQVISGAEATQLGKLRFLSIGGTLFDRPPLLLEGFLSTDPPVFLSVLNLHQRSLLGIEGDNATFVRTKRHEQAIAVAQMAQERQDQNLIVVGDFNAYPFSDGYVDVVNQISGQPSLGALFAPQAIVSPPLNNLHASLPPEQQYSYVFGGNAQLLDHALSTRLSDVEITGMSFARANADFAYAYGDNEFLPQRASDHDGFVLYLKPSFPLVRTDDAPALQTERFISGPNPAKPGDLLHLDVDTGGQSVRVQWWSHTGKRLKEEKTASGKQAFIVPDLPSGVYLLRLMMEDGKTLEKRMIIH